MKSANKRRRGFWSWPENGRKSCFSCSSRLRLRIDELINLRVSDVDMATGSLRVAPERKIALFAYTLGEILGLSESQACQVHSPGGKMRNAGDPKMETMRAGEDPAKNEERGSSRREIRESTNANKYVE